MNKIIVFILSSFCLLFIPVHGSAASQQDMASDVLVYINQYRASKGLSALTMNPVLSAEAARHSQDMAQHRLPFGHDGFASRIKHAQQKIKNGGAGAENVAFNYKTAKIVVENWIKSPGHQHNIVGHYNQTGIGLARDSQGRIYYTQLFLRTDQQIAVQTAQWRSPRHRFHW